MNNFSYINLLTLASAVAISLVLVIVYLLSVLKARQREAHEIKTALKDAQLEVSKERERSEKLLEQVLPKMTLEEIKTKGRATHQKFDMVTVLFCDIEGFTRIAEELNPEALIDRLDSFFLHFDTVVGKYNIEKIKTIGDAYMCAGGLPKKNTTNPIDVVLAALEMLEYMHNVQLNSIPRVWDLRIGVHTGPVIAGVIGQKKISYDIWGDTVNIASRMESSGEAGRVNISDHTYKQVKDYFTFEYRGKMPVKYKGKIDMYFISGIKPHLCDSKYPYRPNKEFTTRLQMLRLTDMEEDIVAYMEHEFPENLFYHNYKHTYELHNRVELFIQALGILRYDKLIIRTAALVYDLYYIEYKLSDKVNLKYKYKELLYEYGYNDFQIDEVTQICKCLANPLMPKTLNEKILVDAEYNYLGRIDFLEIISNRFHEDVQYVGVSSKKQWIEKERDFMKHFRFNLEISKRLCEIDIEHQISMLDKSL
ncbi:MAG: adenylate/guanylate cyclase domain-containing protein [Bacteroidales bacterium]|nr:adenylate/guanylate cyclase domain-containing protein [Bacteroidales bacterium]